MEVIININSLIKEITTTEVEEVVEEEDVANITLCVRFVVRMTI